jgi:hypothetical protein
VLPILFEVTYGDDLPSLDILVLRLFLQRLKTTLALILLAEERTKSFLRLG